MLLLIVIDKCKKCCCLHCQEYCFPVTELAIYNAQNDIKEDKYNLDETHVGDDNIEMVDTIPKIVPGEMVSN